MKWGTLTSMVVASLIAATAAAGDVTITLRDAAGKPVADAIVYALPSKGAAPAPAPQARALVDQVNKEFVPRVSIVQAGTEIHFPNSDNIRHSLYSFSPAKTFTTKLYSGREAAPVLFDKPGVVVLGCNIHDQMVAWVYVDDTPWFAKSGADGTATLKSVPAGEYQLSAEQPEAKLTVAGVALRVETAPLRESLTLGAGA